MMSIPSPHGYPPPPRACQRISNPIRLGLHVQIRNLPPEILSYFTAPNPEDLVPPPLESLVPFVEAALPLAYGVFGVQFFHVSGQACGVWGSCLDVS